MDDRHLAPHTLPPEKIFSANPIYPVLTLNSHRCPLFPVERRMINNFFVNCQTDKKFLSKNWQKLARPKMLISLEQLR
jgi:hypothetical protein